MTIWRPGATNSPARLKAKLSQYLKVGQSLGFDSRSRRLDETSGCWQTEHAAPAGYDVDVAAHISGVDLKDPVLGPWRAFAALPAEQFAAKAPDVQRKLTASKDPKAPPVHPLVAKVVLASPPASMNEVVDRYARLFEQLENRLKEQAAKAKAARPLLRCRRRNGSRSDRRSSGTPGRWRSRRRHAASSWTRASASGSSG